MNTAAPLPFTDAPERIAQLIWVLCQTVTERCGFRVRTLSAAQVEYIVARLLAARKRFRWVVERIRAGKAPRWRVRKPRVRPAKPKPEPLSDAETNSGFPPPPGWRRWAREDRARARAARKAALAAAPQKPVPLWRTLRQHLPGWLCGCAPAIFEFPRSGASCAEELRRMLAESEMQALLAAHPCVGDSLRKLCRGLAVDVALLYPAPPESPAPDSAEMVGDEACVPPGETAVTETAPAFSAPRETTGFSARG